MMIRRRALGSLVAVSLVAWGGSPDSALAQLAQQRAHGDFNGDGFDDLAIGVPGEDGGAGAVNVLYGTSAGLSAASNQIWRQGSDGILGTPQENDNFGQTLAAGDFNRDGYGDLAIGAPGEGPGGPFYSVGGVNVLYGSATGLSAAGNQFWDQDRPGIIGENEGNTSGYGENLGAALAAGDFDGDGFTDLAIGAPGETTVLLGALSFVGAFSGAVNVLYGSVAGLNAEGNQFWNQTNGLAGTSEPHDLFGGSLAAADFDGDGFDDLAVGVPGENTGGRNAGAVNLIRGSAFGLSDVDDQFWSQDSDGIGNTSDGNDKFGFALAAGNFNGDGFFDLAIGVPGEKINGREGAGAVSVIFGRSGGLSSLDNQLWHQDVTSTSTGVAIADTAEENDLFGATLAVGDFNGDARDDLAIAAITEDLGIQVGVGVVHVLYGGATVLAPQGNQLWHQNVAGIEGSTEERDNFGYGLAAADFNRDGYVDLAVGVPGDGADDAGAVNVVYGTAAGLAAANDQLWSQESPGVLDHRESLDGLGTAVIGSATGGGGAGVSGEFAEVGRECTGRPKCRLIVTLIAFNPGSFPAGTSATHLFSSTDETVDAGDEFLGPVKVPDLEPEEARELTFELKLPVGSDGAGRFLIAVMDAEDDVPEVNEKNNVVVSPRID